jgi:hypothetical protein
MAEFAKSWSACHAESLTLVVSSRMIPVAAVGSPLAGLRAANALWGCGSGLPGMVQRKKRLLVFSRCPRRAPSDQVAHNV